MPAPSTSPLKSLHVGRRARLSDIATHRPHPPRAGSSNRSALFALLLSGGAALLPLGVLGSGCSRAEPEDSASAPSARPGATHGEPLSGKSPRVPLDAVLKDPDAHTNKTVTVEGKVRRACSRKGCWMELAPGLDESMPGCRVTFKDYGFFVPTDSQGATATVEGEVIVKKVPRGRVTHLEAEGATFAHKNADGSANEIQLVATGVELVR